MPRRLRSSCAERKFWRLARKARCSMPLLPVCETEFAELATSIKRDRRRIPPCSSEKLASSFKSRSPSPGLSLAGRGDRFSLENGANDFAFQTACRAPLMRIIQTVVQLSTSQCVEKCGVIFERTSDSTPNQGRFRVTLREFRNQNVKAVLDSSALVMDNVILAPYRCPNKALTRESGFRYDSSRVPLLAWFCTRPSPAAVTKREDCGCQSAGGMNIVEACRILQHPAIFTRKFCDICAAQALNRDGKKYIKANVVRGHRWP